MIKRKWLIGGAVLALVATAVLMRGVWTTDGVAARQSQARAVPVETAIAERTANAISSSWRWRWF